MAAIAAAAALYWIVDLAVLRAGLPHPLDDIWEDGVVARELIAGHGFQSIVIYPPLWSMRDPSTFRVPVLVHGPLIPILLTGPLRVSGPGFLDHLAWLAAALAVLGALQVFRLGRRWLADPASAVVAAALFTLSPLTLLAVHHSLSVMVGACLLMLTLDLLGRQAPLPLVAGLALGLAYLGRPEMLAAALVLAGFAAWSQGPSAGARFLGGFALVAGGWWVHQWRTSGMPFFNLSSYGLIGTFGTRPEYTVMRDFDLTPDRWPQTFRHELPGLWQKWAAFFPRACRHALMATGWTTGWLAPIGTWAWPRSGRTPAWAIACALVALIPLAMMTAAVPQKLYLMPSLGLYALAGARGLAALVAWRPLRSPRVWIPALAVLLTAAIVPALRDAAIEGHREAELLADERRALVPLTAATADSANPRPIFSDRPDFVAWTTERPAIYVSLDEYRALYPAGGPLETVRPHGLPPRRDPAATWFHADHWSRGQTVR
jgi:hypothetical protein